jgi:hypothetical protein
VSAVVTARSTLAAVGGDRVRALQHALYRSAKADPGRRFHALFDKVLRRDVLDRAWEARHPNFGTYLAQVPAAGRCRPVRAGYEATAGSRRPHVDARTKPQVRS